MDEFQRIADSLVIYKVRSAWFEIAKLYNQMATSYKATMSMGFVLLAINEEEGTPVTKIAPRMGMEPNSLSRLLKTMEKKGAIYRRKDKEDRRKVYICLTEYGMELREVAIQAVFRLEKAITQDINEERLGAFFSVVDHIPMAIRSFREKLESSEKA